MSNVQILSEDIVSKIAAGEVIERPASVVKELVENSIDAKATSIEISLKEAGKTLIQIRDNGSGIEREDLEKIFNRHATSKIKSIDDLYAILSLGFRGEALYSIAAVSDIILQTRSKHSDSGWQIHLRGGKRVSIKPCPFSGTGTHIEIKELFFNTPARKKFLKTNSAEIQQVITLFTPYTLLYPNIRFVLKHQDNTLIDLKPTDQLIDRVAASLSLDEKYLIESKEHFDKHGLTLKTVLGDINIKRARRDLQFIFVNGRPIQSKNISYHVNQIYRLIMPQEHSPFFVIFITLPAENVDSNVHPSKREVKIKDEQQICAFLRTLCEEALMRKGQLKMVQNPSANFSKPLTIVRGEVKDTQQPTDIFEAAYSGSHSDDYAYPKNLKESQSFFIPQDNFINQNAESLQKKLENAKYIGPFMDKYLIFESGPTLLIFDQHAAAERITYEQLIRQMDKGQIEVQNLLAPVLVRVTLQEMLIWEEGQEQFEKLGLSTTKFDKETIAIHTQPLLLKDTEKAIRSLLAGDNVSHCNFETIARRACRASIMAGDKLKPQQAEFQREQLLQCLDPFTCPHGRPTVIELTDSFLNKQFLRS
jgi:DNA mismatch repair protein MutL